MPVKPSSEGFCIFCNKEFSKSGITRHLNTHLTKQSKDGNLHDLSYHLRVEHSTRWGGGLWFLNLWADGSVTFDDLDDFLRLIWLECCGHMSSFRHPRAKRQRGSMFDFFVAEDLLKKGKIEEYEQQMEEVNGEIPMSSSIRNRLQPGMKLEYDYDFGSTTELVIDVIDKFTVKVPDDIILLSRNEPLPILCELCHTAPAHTICSVCICDSEPSAFCKACAKKHERVCDDYADYAAMPVVNSPRMGVCGYEGGQIDKARDGVYVKK